MRRLTFLAVILAIGLSAQSALADSPHFVRASAALSGNDLVVSFKEAGLGTNQTVTIQATASFSRTDSCLNNGGHVPSDPKKTETSGTVSESGNFTSGKNGSVNGSLTLSPLPTTLECPPGQRATLISLTYSNVVVSDLTNGVSKTISGTFSK